MSKNTKIKVKTAKSRLNRFVYEFGHGTTNRFFEPSVPLAMEINAGSKIKLQMSCLRRINPMPLPPMSMVSFRTRFYFVPYIDICPYFDNLISKTPYAFRYGANNGDKISAIPTSTPILKTQTIKQLLFAGFMASAGSHTVGGELAYYAIVTNLGNTYNNYLQALSPVFEAGTNNVVEPDKYDVAIDLQAYDPGQHGISNKFYFNFTKRGRVFYKLLKQLGYDFTISLGEKINTEGYSTKDSTNVSFSALKLLAFLKVYLDYYESSAYFNNTTRLAELNALCHIDKDAYVLTAEQIDKIVDLATYMCYENDYFTTAFVNPANGNTFLTNSEQITISDSTTEGEDFQNIALSSPTNGTAKLQTLDDSVNISQNGLNLLRRLNAYLKRMQVAGGRFVDRILAEYGVSIDNSYSRRTSFIDSIESVMNITPVINTTSEQLGDYAGFGSSKVDKNNIISINVPDNIGCLIAIDTITPEIFYHQGYLRENRHMSKFDFVTPEFDAVGVQAMEQGEILNQHNGKYGYRPSQQTFGYKPRYAENKERYSYLTGDFIVDSVNTDIDSYFTDRRFDEEYYHSGDDLNITCGREFVSTYGSGQYARIFYSDTYQTDYIKSIFRFVIEMESPMEELYNEYKLSDESGGEEVQMQIGGQTMH